MNTWTQPGRLMIGSGTELASARLRDEAIIVVQPTEDRESHEVAHVRSGLGFSERGIRIGNALDAAVASGGPILPPC